MSYQVQQRKQEDPDNIDEVPVKADHVDGCVPGGAKTVPRSHDNQCNKKSRADDHMRGVQAGHSKVEVKKNLRLLLVLRNRIVKPRTGNMMIDPFLVVFHAL